MGQGTRFQRGLSLIEAAMALIIISLLVFPLIKLMETGEESRLIEDSTNRNNEVSAALKRYWMDHGRFPKPASMYARPGDATYGREVLVGDIQTWWRWSNINTDVIPGVIDGFSTARDGYFQDWRGMDGGLPGNDAVTDSTMDWEENQWQGAYLLIRCKISGTLTTSLSRMIIANNSNRLTVARRNDTKIWPNLDESLGVGTASDCEYRIYHGVLIGSVPFADLGLSADQALDPYGRRLTYMVTAHMTATKADGTAPSFASLLNKGGITLVNQLFGRGTDWQDAYTRAGGLGGCRTDSNQNCCAGSVCRPALYSESGLTNSFNIIFALINHGKDGRGAIPMVPVTGIVDDVSPTNPATVTPFAPCFAGGGAGYYPRSLATGLEYDNCDHLDVGWAGTTLAADISIYRASNIRIIQEEKTDSSTLLPTLGAILPHRFNLNPGPFYYDDIVKFATGVDMGGWAERANGAGGSLLQTSNNLTSGYTMLSSPEARPSANPQFPLQVGLSPGDVNYNLAFTPPGDLTDDASLRAGAVQSDLICVYNGSAGSPYGSVGDIRKINTTYSKTAGSLSGDTRMACLSIGRFTSATPYTAIYGLGQAGADGSTFDTRRSSLLCDVDTSPVRGLGYYYGPDRDAYNDNRYFNKSSGSLYEAFLYSRGTGRNEPFLSYDPLNGYGCGHTLTRMPPVNLTAAPATCAGARSTRVTYDATGRATLGCP